MRSGICSVWSWRDRRFHYYALPDDEEHDGDARRQPMPPMRAPLGDPPERLLGVLPALARYLGSGIVARGRIVTLPCPESGRWVT